MNRGPVMAWVGLLLAWPLLGSNPLTGILSPENLKRASARGLSVRPGSRPDTVVLEFTGSGPGELVIPVPKAGRNWTDCGAFTFEFASDSTIRWFLGINTREAKDFGYSVQPYEGVPVKAAISSAYPLLTPA